MEPKKRNRPPRRLKDRLNLFQGQLLERLIFVIQFFLHDVACAAVHINAFTIRAEVGDNIKHLSLDAHELTFLNSHSSSTSFPIL